MEGGGLRGARGVLINITASSELGLHQVNEACNLVREAADNEDVQINFGVVLDEDMGDEVKITVIATGFQRENLPRIERRPAKTEAVALPPPPPPLDASQWIEDAEPAVAEPVWPKLPHLSRFTKSPRLWRWPPRRWRRRQVPSRPILCLTIWKSRRSCARAGGQWCSSPHSRQQVQDDAAPVWLCPVLEQVNALPRP